MFMKHIAPLVIDLVVLVIVAFTMAAMPHVWHGYILALVFGILVAYADVGKKVLSSLAYAEIWTRARIRRVRDDVTEFLRTSLYAANIIADDETIYEHERISYERAPNVRLTTHLTQDEPLLRYVPNRSIIAEDNAYTDWDMWSNNAPRTGWISGSVQPNYPGVYERMYWPETNCGVYYCMWDGTKWYIAADSVSKAAKEFCTSSHQTDFPWKGVPFDTLFLGTKENT